MAFFSKLKHAFGFNDNGDDLDDELGYDMSTAPYVNPFRPADKAAEEQPPAADRTADPASSTEESDNPLAQRLRQQLQQVENEKRVANTRANSLANRINELEQNIEQLEQEAA